MKPSNPNPCDEYLSDRDYLLHMIPHHQVAVDVSIDLQKTSNNPVMQTILRKLIWTQNREIMMMKDVLKSQPDNLSNDDKMNPIYINTIMDFTKLASDPNAECKKEFFDPELHKKHMSHMKLDEKMYIHHMIPHHQVAIDMCHRLLLHTNNTHMLALCYDIIREQQYEILQMNQMLDSWNTWQYTSNKI